MSAKCSLEFVICVKLMNSEKQQNCGNFLDVTYSYVDMKTYTIINTYYKKVLMVWNRCVHDDKMNNTC